MKILMTLAAAALASAAIASPAFAESIISCDSALPTDMSISADNCRAWGIAALSAPAPAAFAYVAPRTKVAAPKRAHHHRAGY